MGNGKPAKFVFYEVVVVNSTQPEKDHLNGKEGAILGMAQSDDGSWGYAVHIYGLAECWDFMESELQAAGRHDQRESFYSGESIQVRVDPKTGEGVIVPPPPESKP